MFNIVFFGNSGASPQNSGNEFNDYPVLLFSPALWLDAADSSTITQSNGSVSQWRDKSGNNRDHTQGTSSAQPIYTLNGLNGLNTIVFNGSSHHITGLSGLTDIGDFSIFMVGTTVHGRGLDVNVSNANFQGWNIIISSGAFNVIFQGPELRSISWIGGTLRTAILHQGFGLRGGGNGNFTSLNFSTRNLRSSTVDSTIGRVGSLSGFGSGYIAEYLIFNRVVSTEERQILEGYLAWKWGLVASLPTDHPYKNTAPPFTFLNIAANDELVLLALNEPTAFTFTVTRSGKLTKETTVNYAVSGTGSNPATAAEFGGTFPSGTVTFAPNETTKTISVTVTITSETLIKQFAVTLSNPVNGDLVNSSAVSRFTDNINPLLGFSPALWLDAADSSTITQSNGSVSQWRDKSINLNHLVQATAANQPTYENLFVRFTSTRFLAITSRQVFANTTQGSVFFVGNQAGMTRTGWGCFGVNQSNYTPSDGALYDSFLATSRPQITGNVIPHPMPNSIISYENTGSQLIARRNGTQVGIVDTTYRIPLANTSEQRVGGTMGDFDHQEILMFPRVLTQSEREVIEGYLAWKWGLVGSLPSTHPYKNTAPPFTFLNIAANDPLVVLELNEPTAFTFTVTRSGNLTKETTVNYAVSGTGSNPATAAEFGGTFPSGTVTFAPNETTKTISVTVTITSETLIKQFAVTLSNPVNGDLVNSSAVSRFTNNEIIKLSPALWLDAADSSTITQSNGSVSQWRDKSGKNRDANQGTSSIQPAYDATNKFVEVTSTRVFSFNSQIFENANSASIFLVARNPSGGNVYWGGFPVGDDYYIFQDGFIYSTFCATNRTAVNYSPQLTSTTIIEIEHTGSQHRYYRDGSARGIVNIGFSIPSTASQRLGGRGNYIINEMLTFSKVLTTTDRQILEGYLAWKWGLVASLPIDHPYKNTAPF